MHLIENYALNAAVKIDRPFIDPAFFPVASNDYITIHCSSGMPSKNFDYYEDVLKLIKPYLSDHNIDIIQIGLEGEPLMHNAQSLLGQTNLRQAAYVIKNSKLHLGNDSFACHFASYFNTPIVALYGPAIKETCRPYWGDQDKQILLEPDTKGQKPSYSAEERSKRVNSISTFKIASSVLDLLGIKHNLNEYNQIFIGDSFHHPTIDVVPNFDYDDKPELHNVSYLNLRLDYSEHNDYLEQWLTKKPVNVYINSDKYLDIIKKHLNNVSQIHVTLDLKSKKTLASDIFNLNKHCQFYAENDENLPKIRINFFNVDVLNFDSKEQYSLDISNDMCDNYFQSSLKLYSNSKAYPCKAYLDIEKESSKEQVCMDNEEFYKELVFFKIYDKNKN